MFPVSVYLFTGYDDEFNTWEPEWNLDCENLIKDYCNRRQYEQVEKILGATTSLNGGKESITLVVQYTTKEKSLIPIAQACQRFPKLVLKYFEQRLIWKYENVNNKLQYLKEEELKKIRAKTRNFRGGFAKNYIPEAICGVINTVEGLLIVIKWKDLDVVELVPAEEAHNNCPDLLLNYYNERIEWKDTNSTDIFNS